MLYAQKEDNEYNAKYTHIYIYISSLNVSSKNSYGDILHEKGHTILKPKKTNCAITCEI